MEPGDAPALAPGDYEIIAPVKVRLPESETSLGRPHDALVVRGGNLELTEPGSRHRVLLVGYSTITGSVAQRHASGAAARRTPGGEPVEELVAVGALDLVHRGNDHDAEATATGTLSASVGVTG